MKGGRRCQFSGLCPSVVPPPPPPSLLLAILCHPTKYKLAGSKSLQKIFRFPPLVLIPILYHTGPDQNKGCRHENYLPQWDRFMPFTPSFINCFNEKVFSTSLCPWDLTSTLTCGKKLVIFVARTWQPSFCSFLPDGIHLGWLG